MPHAVFYHLTNSYIKPALKGDSSRARPVGDAARGESGGIGSIASGSAARRPYSNQRCGCECNEQPEGLHRGCSCLRQPLSQLRCQLPVRGAFWVPSPRMHAPDIPQIIAYMLKLTSISCFSIVMPIYIDNLMIIGYLITIRRGLCMKEINSFG